MYRHKVLICSAAAVLAAIIIIYALFFASLAKGDKAVSVDIRPSDDVAGVMQQVSAQTGAVQMLGFRIASAVMGYKSHIRTGHYEFRKEGALRAVRHLRNGMQTPIELTIPSVRTVEDLSGQLSHKLMLDSTEILRALSDPGVCARYDCDTATILCLFIPNTYEMYWNIPLDKFLKRMQQESEAFWTPARRAQARAAGLTPTQVLTLASIVDEETADNGEKPMIAGMYLNRYKQGMPLQADPTIKFSLKQFGLKRIYTNQTFVRSPYNTYRNIGLPPGPIRIPSVAGINAVLNYVHHDYLYMCAKEDFSGTHNFARTYAEHLQNAAKYSQALNQRGIE